MSGMRGRQWIWLLLELRSDKHVLYARMEDKYPDRVSGSENKGKDGAKFILNFLTDQAE